MADQQVGADARDGRRRRQLRASALLLGAALLSGLTLGALLPADLPFGALTIPALGLQTLLTVGGLPPTQGSSSTRGGLLLLVIHHAAMTLPLTAAAIIVGLDTAVGFGVFLIGAAPPAAVVPAYAEAAGVDARPVLAFCLLGYVTALAVTPAMIFVAAGATLGLGALATTLGAGLIGPALLGRALHPRIVALPRQARQGAIAGSLFTITLGLGGGVVEGLRGSLIDPLEFLLVIGIATARTFGSGWLARRLSPPALDRVAPFAGGFKNIALAAAVAGTLFGPAAAIPALACFPAEVAYFLWLARSGRLVRGQPEKA